MKTTIPVIPIADYPSSSPGGYKLKVIKSPDAMITFRKKFYSDNAVLGSRIYFATDEMDRDFVVKEYRLTGSKSFKKSLGWFSSGALHAKRVEAIANLEADFSRVELLGRAFGPRGYCLNKSTPASSTKCYAFQRLLKDKLPNLMQGMLQVVGSEYDVARFVAVDVARDVAVLHAKDCLHLDIKPENICLVNNRLQLIDLDCSGTGESVKVRGSTAEYAPPEQMINQIVTKAADIFALGILFFELVQPLGSRLLGWHKFTTQGGTVQTDLVLGQYSEYRNNIFTNIAPGTLQHFRSFDAVLDRTSAPYARLVRSMIESNPNSRPTIQNVVRDLESVEMNYAEATSEIKLRNHLGQLPSRPVIFQEERRMLAIAIGQAKSAHPNTFWQRR